jgi:hypothetical protein
MTGDLSISIDVPGSDRVYGRLTETHFQLAECVMLHCPTSQITVKGV